MTKQKFKTWAKNLLIFGGGLLIAKFAIYFATGQVT